MSDPGDETPGASGCANDCVHPDHQHAAMTGQEMVAAWRRSLNMARAFSNFSGTWDEWIKLNEGREWASFASSLGKSSAASWCGETKCRQYGRMTIWPTRF